MTAPAGGLGVSAHQPSFLGAAIGQRQRFIVGGADVRVPRHAAAEASQTGARERKRLGHVVRHGDPILAPYGH